MKKEGLYSTDPDEITQRVKRENLMNLFVKKPE